MSAADDDGAGDARRPDAALAPLGDRAVRLAIASADEGQARAAALRASSRVDDAWHTETHLAFTPRPGQDPRALAALGVDGAAGGGRDHALAVVLDGPDRADVARAAGLTVDDVERRLLAAELRVSFVGFAPGFAYLRGLDPRLHLPRRASPRPRVPAGSLALAGGFAAVYPGATAGGWHLVGRALDPTWLGDAPRLAAGDRVRLVRAEAAGPAATIAARTDADAIDVARPALVIEDVRGLAFVQDAGRFGRMHQGVPPGGALVASALAAANRAVGNPAGAAAIERFGALRLAATAATTVATDDGVLHPLGAGDVIDLPWSATARVGYVAIAGGLAVPPVLGGRGTLVRAALGGHHGRALRRGDRLPIFSGSGSGSGSFDSPLADARGLLRTFGTHERDVASDPDPDSNPAAPVTVIVGPDVSRFAPTALTRLLTTTWHLAHASDRMGTRLGGATLPHAAAGAAAASAPLIVGAIEVPPDGAPIVLGPEHPTTGGYPVIAVVAAADLDAFHRRPLGGTVRFRLPPPRR